jgi:acetyl-CoA carboxylase, biotin carboxylase subunit
MALKRVFVANRGEFHVEGVPTTIGLHRKIIAHPDFRANTFHTRWLEQVLLPGLENKKDAA